MSLDHTHTVTFFCVYVSVRYCSYVFNSLFSLYSCIVFFLILLFFLFFSFFLFVFTKRGSDPRAPVKFFLSRLKSFKTQPSERGLGPNWRRGEEIWREAVRKISAGETERGRGQHRLFVHDCVCVLADTLLFPWCQSPSGGWINGVGLTWVRRGMQMVCVCVVLCLYHCEDQFQFLTFKNGDIIGEDSDGRAHFFKDSGFETLLKENG